MIFDLFRQKAHLSKNHSRLLISRFQNAIQRRSSRPPKGSPTGGHEGLQKKAPKGIPKGRSKGQSQRGIPRAIPRGIPRRECERARISEQPAKFLEVDIFFLGGVQNRGPKGGPKEGSQRGVKKGPNAICGIHVVRVFLLCIHISVTDKVICFETYRLANPFDVKL